MNIAEFFVTLGVKGSDSAKKAVSGVDDSLSTVKKTSLETKAAILAVVYGLERMMSGSTKLGAGLQQLSSYTGLSSKSLQQWQYAGKQFGLSAEEINGSIESVQKSMGAWQRNEAQFKGTARIGLDKATANDTFAVLEKAQEYAKKGGILPSFQNEMLESIGLSKGMIAAMKAGVFNAQNFANAPVMSDGQIKSLTGVGAQWANLGQNIELAFASFTAKNGSTLVRDISKITKAVLGLGEAMLNLSTQSNFFGLLASGADKIATSIDTISAFLAIFGSEEDQKKMEKYIRSKTSKEDNAAFDKKMKAVYQGYLDAHKGEAINKNIAVPKINSGSPGVKKQEINIKQDLHFNHEGKDPKKTGDSVKAAVGAAYRQIPTTAQES